METSLLIGAVILLTLLLTRAQAPEEETIDPASLGSSPAWSMSPDAGMIDPLPALPRAPRDTGAYDNQIIYATDLNGMIDPLAPLLVKAIITHESGWNPRALGDAGCSKGFMQVNACAHPQLDAAYDLFDPDQNILAGCQLLANEYRRYWPDWERCLVGYNGPALARSGTTSNRYSQAVAGHFRRLASAAGIIV